MLSGRFLLVRLYGGLEQLSHHSDYIMAWGDNKKNHNDHSRENFGGISASQVYSLKERFDRLDQKSQKRKTTRLMERSINKALGKIVGKGSKRKKEDDSSDSDSAADEGSSSDDDSPKKKKGTVTGGLLA